MSLAEQHPVSITRFKLTALQENVVVELAEGEKDTETPFVRRIKVLYACGCV
jgi:hypothetical protein